MPQKLEWSTSRDRGQCEALIAALTHEFVLIQGSPATDKSYLGAQILMVRVPIKNKGVAKLGPNVVVSYSLFCDSLTSPFSKLPSDSPRRFQVPY